MKPLNVTRSFSLLFSAALVLLFTSAAVFGTSKENRSVSYEMNPAAEMYSDQLPQPVGGYEALIDRVDYPSLALNAKVEGNVLAKITLDENGNVEDVQLVKSIGAGCDESVIKAIKDTKFIYPSNYEGSTVLNQFNIMFRFSLK